jgi:hypothetical protein
MKFEECGGIFELALFVLAALILDVAELDECFLELAREACAVETEAGERGDQGLGAGDFGEQVGSRSGMRRRRQDVSASSWTSSISVWFAG